MYTSPKLAYKLNGLHEPNFAYGLIVHIFEKK